MGATKLLEVNGWPLVVGDDDVPRVRDLELGARLGFARPRDFRKLVERLRRDGIINDIQCRATVARHKVGDRGGFQEVVEYHLDERSALLAIVKSETPKAVEITGQVIDVYLEVRRSPPQPVSVALDVAHGPRVGETVLERAELVSWCTLAALALGVSIHRVHGAIRRTYRVPSAYAVSVFVWPMVRSFLEALTQRKLLLPGARPRLVASAPPGQLSLFQGGRA